MKILENYRLYFCRYTPDQSTIPNFDHPIIGPIEEETYDKNIYYKCNEQWTKKQHRLFMCREHSSKNKRHYHLLLLVPISITTVRKELKKRLNAFGNKQIATKEYPYSQESFDKSMTYLIKGQPLKESHIFPKCSPVCKSHSLEGFELELKDYIWYQNNWIPLKPKPKQSNANQQAKDEKYAHYKNIILEDLKKDQKDNYLYIHLINIGYKNLKCRIFEIITRSIIRKQNFGQFRSVSEMTQWLALDLWEQVEDITPYIKDHFEKQNSQYETIII